MKEVALRLAGKRPAALTIRLPYHTMRRPAGQSNIGPIMSREVAHDRSGGQVYQRAFEALGAPGTRQGGEGEGVRLGSLLRDGDRVVCLGDSITADPESYVTMAREVIRLARPSERIAILNAGADGNTAQDMLARFERDVLPRRPTWVTISTGMNEATLGVPLTKYQESLTALLSAAAAARLGVGLCTTTMFESNWAPGAAKRGNELLEQYNAWLGDVAREQGLLLIPMDEMFRRARQDGDREGDLRLTTDGAHMAPIGRYLMGLTFLAAFGISLPTEPHESSAAR